MYIFVITILQLFKNHPDIIILSVADSMLTTCLSREQLC